MLLCRFGQSNKFWRKLFEMLKKFWYMQVWVLWRSFRGHPENVLGTSQVNLPEKFLECQIRTSSGCHFRTLLGWSNRIFTGCTGDHYLLAENFLAEFLNLTYLLSSGILNLCFLLVLKQSLTWLFAVVKASKQ